ncbi:MAG TPA: hypothetical protein VFL13_03485 [Candidatus Baltobacteraceae bacterium]|nr:hypothetical protein [Candidatus Baltobacteraceae bacterium]
MPNLRRLALQTMAGYYIATGLWPILHRRSFEAVTGPKTDFWLVQMVGLLAATNGTAIAIGLRKRKIRESTVALALLSAASFAAIDVVHVARKRISPIYLGDAVAEAMFAVAVLAAASD